MAFGVPFKLDLGGVDELAALTKVLLCAVCDNRDVKGTLSDGTVLSGVLHESGTCWVGPWT